MGAWAVKQTNDPRRDDSVCPEKPILKAIPFSMVPANAQRITFDDPSYVDLWRPSAREALPPEIYDYAFRELVEQAQQCKTEKEFREWLAKLIEYEGVTANGYRLLAKTLRQGLQKKRGRPRIDDRINEISLKFFGLSGGVLTPDLNRVSRREALREICREYSVSEQEASRLFARAKNWTKRPGVLIRLRPRNI